MRIHKLWLGWKPAGGGTKHQPHIASKNQGWFFAFLVILCAATYWTVLKYPYIQDDWGVLSLLLGGEDRSVLTAQFLAQHPIMYRPLPWLYFSLIVNLAGPDAFLHHLLMIVLHSCTSFLVFLTVRSLGEKDPIPHLSACLYLTAVSVHMDPMMWLVGTYDLAAALFFFLTLFLFMRGREKISALTFLLALLCKESVVPLPVVLLLILLLHTPVSRGRMRTLLPHGLILVFYLAFQAFRGVGHPSEDLRPYAMDFSFSLAAANLANYVSWLAETWIPAQIPERLIPLLFASALLLLVISWIPSLTGRRAANGRAARGREMIFWPAWIFVMLLPVLFLRDHAYRYYLTYSLVPGIVLFLRSLARILGLFGANRRIASAGTIVYAVLACGASVVFLHLQSRSGWNERPLEGTNRLIGKGSEVLQVRDYMQKNRDDLRRYPVILLDGLDSSLFGGSLGPRLWLGQPTLRIFSASQATIRGSSLQIADGGEAPIVVRPGDARVLEAELDRGNWTGAIIGRSIDSTGWGEPSGRDLRVSRRDSISVD